MLFATEGFGEDHEGIAVYPTKADSGYIIISDQENDHMRIYRREGAHEFVKTVPIKADDTDGIEVSTVAVSDKYPDGIFVAMSTDKTFHFYSWRDLIDYGDSSSAGQADSNN
jgi:3-phytase